MFEFPVCVSIALDFFTISVYCFKPSSFGPDEDSQVWGLLNPLHSILLLVVLAALRVLAFVPYVWRYQKDDLLVLSQRPYLWHLFNLVVILFKAIAELVQKKQLQNSIVWLVICGSLVSVYCQSVALKQLVSSALPDRHLVLGMSLPPAVARDRVREGASFDLKANTSLATGRSAKRSSDRLLAGRVASYYTEPGSAEHFESHQQQQQLGSDNAEFLQRLREQLDTAHNEWNLKIVRLKESISNFGTDNNSFSKPDTAVFEELLLLFATNSNNPNNLVDATTDTSRSRGRGRSKSRGDSQNNLRAPLDPLPDSAGSCSGSCAINTKKTILGLFARHPKTLEFYIPQLVVYLLYGHAPTSAELREALLTICSQSAVFAHRIYYFIEAYCIAGAGVTPDGVSVLRQLLQGIEEGALHAAEQIAGGHGNGERGAPVQPDETGGACFVPDAPALYLAGHLEVDEEAPPGPSSRGSTPSPSSPGRAGGAAASPCVYPLLLTCPLLSGSNAFTSTILFWEQLSALSRDLVPFSKEERSEELKKRIVEVKKRFLPSSCVYAPVSNVHHRIWSIIADECFAFSTKTRAPMFVCLEVVDYTAPAAAAARPVSTRQSWVYGFKRAVGESFSLAPSRIDYSHDGDRQDDEDEDEADEDSGQGSGTAAAAALCPHSKHKQAESSNESAGSSAGSSRRQRQEAAGQWSGSSRRQSRLSGGQSRGEGESASLIAPPKPGDNSSTSSDFVEYRERASISHDSLDQCFSPTLSLPEQPRVVFKERWRDKERRMRAKSGVGNLPGYRLLPVIVKTNDDLRQEEIAAQLLFLMNQILLEGDVQCWLRPYGIVAMSPDSGLIEAIPDTVSMDALRRTVPDYSTLRTFFLTFFGGEDSAEFAKARDNFVKSLAPYCIVCYLLNLKDRHNGNILLDRKGHVMHIDFGFIFGISPGGNIGFESAPFKLTAEFVELLDGAHSPLFHRFRDICVKTFMELRKHHYRIALLLEMMSVGNEHLPCFAGDPGRIIDEMRARFVPHIHDQAASEHVHQLVNQSLDNWTTSCYDRYQKCCVGVF